MQIIIVGCGKVGRKLIHELSEENHNITIVDTDSEAVKTTALKYDVMGIEGNGTSYRVLEDADIKNADVLIAVTHSDEVNLLCCFIAKKSGCRTIARVRNPIYLAEGEIFRKELGISIIINPERSAAREIVRLLQFPSALDISSFAKSVIDMITFKVKENSILIGRQLAAIPELQKYQILICMAERGNEIIIPNGDYVIQKGDKLSFIALPGQAAKVFREMGIYSNSVKSVIIVGGGEFGFYTAKMLIDTGMYVKIIEKDKARCNELAALLPKAVIINGDGCDQTILTEEGLENADALIAAMNIDEENIILSLYAKDKVRKKVVTKISHLEFNNVIQSLDLDSVINPKEITGEYILRYVRAISNRRKGSDIQTLYKLKEERVEAIEFIVDNESSLIGREFKDLNLKPDVLIAGIVRKGKLIIPGGSDMFMAGDNVVIATTNKGFQILEDIEER